MNLKSRFLPLLIPGILALFVSSTAAGFSQVDTIFTMSDGARINATYYLPTSPRPAAGYPAIMLVHGFGGSKQDPPGAFGPLYADSGYFSVAYTVRGQGLADEQVASSGAFNWFTGDRELEDARVIINWLRTRANVNAERIGVEGISQGGLTAWGCAAKGMPVRCIVPIIAVPSYSRAFTFNGCNNWAVMVLLYAARTLSRVNMGPFLGDTVYNGYGNDEHAKLVELFRERDLDEEIATLQVPVYLQVGWHDEIFNPRDAMRAFAALQGPKKLMVYAAGHGLPTNVPTALARLEQTLRFYRRWLKDDQNETVMNPDSVAAMFDNGAGQLRWFSAGQFTNHVPPELPAVSSGARTLYLASDNRLTATEPVQRVAITDDYVKDVTNEAFLFASQQFTAPQVMTGARVRLILSSTARRYQANVLLYDYDSIANTVAPICRGSYEVRLAPGDTPGVRTVEYDLAPQLYTIAPGHRIVAAVKFGMPGGALALQKPEGEFGQSPYAPAENATTTLYSTARTEPAFGPSFITLFFPGESGMDVPLPRLPSRGTRTAGVVGSPALGGAPLVIVLDEDGAHGDGNGTIRVLDLNGRTVFADDVAGNRITLRTDAMAAGTYTFLIRRGDDTWRGRFMVVR